MTFTKEIVDGRGVKCGDMKCTSCKRVIEDEYYLLKNYYVSKRGNEDDYGEIFCIDCSSKDTTWKKWFSDIRKQVNLEVVATRTLKREAITLIRKATDIEISKEYGDTHIIISNDNKEDERSFVFIKGYDRDYPEVKTTLRRALTGVLPQIGEIYLGWLVIEEVKEVTFEEFFKGD